MNKRQKTTILGAMLLCSLLSTVYLSVEMSAYEAAVSAQEVHSLPDVRLLQNFLKMIIEPLAAS